MPRALEQRCFPFPVQCPSSSRSYPDQDSARVETWTTLSKLPKTQPSGLGSLVETMPPLSSPSPSGSSVQMVEMDEFGYLSHPSKLPMSLILLRVANDLLLPDETKRKSTAFLTRKIKSTHVSYDHWEKLAEDLGVLLNDLDQWADTCVVMMPEWYERPETTTGSKTMIGTYDRILHYKRRAKRGLAVFSKKDD